MAKSENVSKSETITISRGELQRLIDESVAREVALREEARAKLKAASKPKKCEGQEEWFVDGEWVKPLSLVHEFRVGDTSVPRHKKDAQPAVLKPGYVWKWVRDTAPDGTEDLSRIEWIQAYGGEIYIDPTTNEPLRRGRLVLMQWPREGKAAFLRDHANPMTTRGRRHVEEDLVEQARTHADELNRKVGRRIVEPYVGKEHHYRQETVSTADVER